MKSKQFLIAGKIIGIVVVFLLLFSNCSTTTTVPYFYSNNSNYDFIILGEVTYENSTQFGFQELLKAAKSKYRNCDYVIDVMVDAKTTTTGLFLLSWTKTTYTMRGTAIRYIQNNTTGESTSATSNSAVTNTYTVRSTNGTVQKRTSNGGFVIIGIGEVLPDNTTVRVGANSSLVLANGGETITIPAGTTGVLSLIISRVGSMLILSP